MMVERVGVPENVKKDDDDEIEMLLGEIPHVTSLGHHHHHHHHEPSHSNDHHHHHHHVVNGMGSMNRMMNGVGMYDDDPSCSHKKHSHSCTSTPGAFSLQSNASFPSLFSKDPIPKPHFLPRNSHSESPDSCFGTKVDEDSIDESGLSCSLGRMYINENPMEFVVDDHVSRGSICMFDGKTNQESFGFQQNSGFQGTQVPHGQVGTLFPQSNLDRRHLNGMADYCHQTKLPSLASAFSNGSYDTNQNGMSFSGLSEDSLVIQHDVLGHIRSKGIGGLRGQSACGNGRILRAHWALNTLTEARGCIFMIAKDQNGCRLLQKVFEEGSPQAVQIAFDEIIGHVVELMVNPFGNYLMQKLLEVCDEEQRMHIVVAVTREPKELVRISLNTHGTRVVQKLIEILKTTKQVQMVVSALKPGFLDLTKDLNGNHVIQRCLQCLSHDDNKFIFEAAARFCVEIATHQHGCCVLQRCINHSTGEQQERLVVEISSHGLLLAQDPFGNYVVQSILELRMPSAATMLTSQFVGQYVHLATQKFSSHVVEKCLSVFDDQARSMIVRELVSATHFEQLLQDPHANYVIQTALRVTEGPLHNALVKEIESHKAVSRNSPYSKRIFSNKLLKR